MQEENKNLTIFKLPLLAVNDVELSKKFYCELFCQEVVLDLGINVTFSGGFAIQEKFEKLLNVPKNNIIFGSNDMELYFETDDIDCFVKKMESYEKIDLVHPLKTHEWGQRVIRLYDPDKHIIEVGENISAVAARIFSECGSIEETARLMDSPTNIVKKWIESSTILRT